MRNTKSFKDWKEDTKNNLFEQKKAKDAAIERKKQDLKDRENLDYVIWNGRPLTRTPHLQEAIGIARERNARVFFALEGAMVGEVET